MTEEIKDLVSKCQELSDLYKATLRDALYEKTGMGFLDRVITILQSLESPDMGIIEQLAPVAACLRANSHYQSEELVLKAISTIRALARENKELAIKLGATEEAFTDFRGHQAGKVCMLCNMRERAACYANTEKLEARVAELEQKLSEYDKELVCAINFMDLYEYTDSADAYRVVLNRIRSIGGPKQGTSDFAMTYEIELLGRITELEQKLSECYKALERGGKLEPISPGSAGYPNYELKHLRKFLKIELTRIKSIGDQQQEKTHEKM